MAENTSPGIIFFIALMGSFLLFSTISNFIIIAIVVFTKKMRTVTNILIANLAVSDIILGTFILPQNLHDLTHTGDYHEGINISVKLLGVFGVYTFYECNIYCNS